MSKIERVSVLESEEASTWLFSDPHFDHTNIIKYCNRPFYSVQDMNRTILANWNRTIGPDDIVFFLGDIAFGRGSRGPWWWLEQLNGRIIYIKGSHDKGISSTMQLPFNGVVAVYDNVIMQTRQGPYLLQHEPVLPYHWLGPLVHGHVHNNYPFLYERFGQTFVNVSCEVISYTPISVSKLLADTVITTKEAVNA